MKIENEDFEWEEILKNEFNRPIRAPSLSDAKMKEIEKMIRKNELNGLECHWQTSLDDINFNLQPEELDSELSNEGFEYIKAVNIEILFNSM